MGHVLRLGWELRSVHQVACEYIISKDRMEYEQEWITVS